MYFLEPVHIEGRIAHADVDVVCPGTFASARPWVTGQHLPGVLAVVVESLVGFQELDGAGEALPYVSSFSPRCHIEPDSRAKGGNMYTKRKLIRYWGAVVLGRNGRAMPASPAAAAGGISGPALSARGARPSGGSDRCRRPHPAATPLAYPWPAGPSSRLSGCQRQHRRGDLSPDPRRTLHAPDWRPRPTSMTPSLYEQALATTSVMASPESPMWPIVPLTHRGPVRRSNTCPS